MGKPINERDLGDIQKAVKSLESLRNTTVPRPHFMILNVTERCNSRCAYCWIWRFGDKAAQVSATAYERLLKEAKALGAWQVVLSGGEPLLRPDLEQIVNTAATQGFLVVVVTNGLNLTEQRVERLIDAGAGVITLSLDTLETTTYEQLRGVPIAQALRALHVLEHLVAKNTVEATISCVLSALNYCQIQEVVARATDHGMSVQVQACHTYGLPALNHLGATPEIIEDLRDSVQALIEMKRAGYRISSSAEYLEYIPTYLLTRSIPPGYRCNYGDVAITVDHQLDLLPCWFLPPIGNLRQASLESLWFSKAFTILREAMKRGECPGCWLICSADWEISCPGPIRQSRDG